MIDPRSDSSSTWVRIARGSGANVFAQMVVLLTQLLLVPIMANTWGVERYGVWLLLFTIPSFLALGDLGFGTAAGTKMTMLAALGDHQSVVHTFQSAILAIGITSVLIMIVGSVVILIFPFHGVDSFTRPEIRTALLVLLAYGIVCLQGSLVQGGFRCSGRYALGTGLQAFTMLVEALVATATVILGGSLVALAIGYLLCRTFLIASQAVILHRLTPWLAFGLQRASMQEIRDLLPSALAVMALPVAQAVFLQGSALMIGLAVSAKAVAIFTSVRTLTRVGVQFTTLTNHAVMPELSAFAAREEWEKVRKIVLLTIATSFVIIIPVSLVLVSFGPKIVEVWTRGAIEPSFALIATMTAVMCVNSIWHPLSNLLLAVNRQATYSYAYALAACVTIAASYPLCRAIGEVGAALAILVLDLFMLLLVARLIIREFSPFSKKPA